MATASLLAIILFWIPAFVLYYGAHEMRKQARRTHAKAMRLYRINNRFRRGR